MSDKYILDGHTPVPCDDLLEWGRRLADDRIVRQDNCGPYHVSTVFLGLDHRHGGDGPPLLFETMIFGEGAPLDQWQERCSTWDEAEAAHQRAAALARGSLS